MEKYIDLPNYKGLYMVSNYGNVKSLARYSQNRDGRNRMLKEKLLKPVLRNGYKRITLRKDNIRKHYDVHVLVAMAFLNHTPNGYKVVVDHIDGDIQNNSLGNLQLISHRENVHKGKLCEGGTSEYIGVYWESRRGHWIAQIKIDGKNCYLGSYKHEIDAHRAYQKVLVKNYYL